jgi:hypothetical protein
MEGRRVTKNGATLNSADLNDGRRIKIRLTRLASF